MDTSYWHGRGVNITSLAQRSCTVLTRLTCRVHSVMKSSFLLCYPTAQCSLCTVFTIYSVHYVQCSLYTVFTMYSVHYVLCSLCTVFTVYSVHCVQCSLCTVFIMYSVHYVQCSLCTVCTMYTMRFGRVMELWEKLATDEEQKMKETEYQPQRRPWHHRWTVWHI